MLSVRALVDAEDVPTASRTLDVGLPHTLGV